MPELTYGGRAVGLTFNPSGDERVNKIKTLYANIIDELVGPNGDALPACEKSDLTMIAMRQAQSAQMWAVKAVTWRDEPSPSPTEPGPLY